MISAAGTQLGKALRTFRWLPAYAWGRLARRPHDGVPLHLMIGIANHFEPELMLGRPGQYAEMDERERRVEAWCQRYPKMADPWRDADGMPLRHTYFYPAEHYDKRLIDRLRDHCLQGWGEIEIHLHHGIGAPDSAENTRRTLLHFREALAGHGCLSYFEDHGPARYAFVHGNWALANSAGGRFCGVDEEMQILADTGCYADMTLPSAPNPAQVAKVNAIYECGRPLDKRAPHRRGRNLRSGQTPSTYPLIVQGPLGVRFRRPGWGMPQIENGGLTAVDPPTLRRLALWRKAAISVAGRPDWLFIKLHCHGMIPQDQEALLGEPMRRFLRDLTEGVEAHNRYRVHFVTAREMVNIILAACDDREGNPGLYRDYRLRLRR